VTADTFGSSYDTILAAYRGSCGVFSPVAGGCNDNTGGVQSQVSFPVLGGVTYYFMVSASSGNGGLLVFHLTFNSAVATTSSSTTSTSRPQLTLALNQALFHRGDTLLLTAVVSPGQTLRSVDAYVAIQLPDGSLFYMQEDGSFTPEPQPLLRNWTVASFNAVIFRSTFNGLELPGPYRWLASFTEPGTFTLIGEIAQAPFTFGP